MANWIQSRLKAAEGLLEAVDRTAKTVAVPRWDQQDAPTSVGGRKPPEQVIGLQSNALSSTRCALLYTFLDFQSD